MFYASVGPDLTCYAVDVDAATLTRRDTVTLPAGVQYVWPHPSKPLLYVASSNGGPGRTGDRHHLSAFRVDPRSGALTPHGAAQALPARPIHMSLDRTGGFALTAYNNPSILTVHRLAADGMVGAAVAQPEALDTGIYAHQILATPSNRGVILVTRGNDAAKGAAEDPGALKCFGFNDGVLRNTGSIAPGGGHGFGPRHVDFHPTKPLVYASIERQNEIQVFALNADDTVSREPLFTRPTLAEPANPRPRQLAGAIHVHPNGRFAYVSNRSDALTEFQGKKVWAGGEDSIAVFALDPDTGAPRAVQHADPHTHHVRTFSIDPSGRLMVSASIAARLVRDGDGARSVPAALSVYRVGGDGRLDYVRKYDVETGDAMMFWSGMVTVGG